MSRSKNYDWILLGIGVVELFGILGFVVVRNPPRQVGMSASLHQEQKVRNTERREVLRRIYTAEIGVREATGKNDGPRIQQYLHVVGLRGNYSYCAAFISWTFAQAGMAEPRTGWSPALFPEKRVVWERNIRGRVPVKSTQEITPKTGDVFGIYFQEIRRIGHCGFVDEWNGRWCITVEANTNDVGSVASTDGAGNPIRAGPGEGVYRKKRPIKTIYKVSDWVR